MDNAGSVNDSAKLIVAAILFLQLSVVIIKEHFLKP